MTVWLDSIIVQMGLDNFRLTYWLPVYFLPLTLLPLLPQQFRASGHPAVLGFPEDWLVIWVERIWRWLGALLVFSLCMALAKPYLAAQTIEKVGQGAHVMIVLDRSTSMNDPFGQKKVKGAPSKLDVARDVLKNMVQQSPSDLVGLITFSTSPIFVSSLTSDKTYLQQGLNATQAGGMGFTAVARGLGMALDYYRDKRKTGARAVLLVSDGGAHLDVETQSMLRNMFTRENAALYWVYLRSNDSVSLNAPTEEGEQLDGYPEYALHQYFKSLNVPYHVYEAENPKALSQAISDISHLKNKPTRYSEPIAKQTLSWVFYVLAWLSCAVLFCLHCMEVKR